MILRLLSVLAWVHMVQSAMEGFVVMGNKTRIKNYPHSVYLNIMCLKVTYICGGSILNQRVILTAGHCLEDCLGPNSEVYLKFGHENPSQMSSTRMRQFRIHERYNGESLENDIALVMGNRALPLGRLVSRVALMRLAPRARMAHMAGWGVMNNRNEVSVTLLDTAQEMQSPRVCSLIGPIPHGSFCAGPIKGPGAPDRGDSGSALVIRQFIQIGLVSYKVNHYSLVVYTNVSYFYNWIRHNSRQMFCG